MERDEATYRKEIHEEIRTNTAHLPLYNGGPGVDYTVAEHAYAMNITLLHIPTIVRGTRPVISPDTEALLVQRNGGDGVDGTWGGISGYLDTLSDPTGRLPDSDFDPIAHTTKEELEEECGMSPDTIASLAIHLGDRFSEPRHEKEGTIHVLPLVGVHSGDSKPYIQLNDELRDAAWVPLRSITRRFYPSELSPNYITCTLPRALGARGLERAGVGVAIATLLRKG